MAHQSDQQETTNGAPISRRTFLLSALGLGAAVAVGGSYELLSHPSWLHKLGIENSPDFLVPDGHIRTEAGSFDSEYAGATVRWRLSRPAKPAVGTVFCLHGRGGDHNKPFDELHLHDIAASLDLPLAIVGVDGGDHSYWHQRSDGTDRMAMVINELIPKMEAKTGTTKRALYGWSMGGYGALLAHKTYPTMFGAIAALSPALWTKSGDSAPGAFDNAQDFAEHDVFPGRSVRNFSNVRFSCGTNDPFYQSTRAFTSQTVEAEVDFGDGFHDPAYWRSVSPAALRFIHQKLAA